MKAFEPQLLQQPCKFPSPTCLTIQHVKETLPKLTNNSPYDIIDNPFYEIFGEPPQEAMAKTTKMPSSYESIGSITVPMKSRSDRILTLHINDKKKKDLCTSKKSTARRFISPDYRANKLKYMQTQKRPIPPSPTFYISGCSVDK